MSDTLFVITGLLAVGLSSAGPVFEGCTCDNANVYVGHNTGVVCENPGAITGLGADPPPGYEWTLPSAFCRRGDDPDQSCGPFLACTAPNQIAYSYCAETRAAPLCDLLYLCGKGECPPGKYPTRGRYVIDCNGRSYELLGPTCR